MYKLTHFVRHLYTTLESLTGDVIRHAKTVMRQKGGDKVFMWNVHKLFSDSSKQ